MCGIAGVKRFGNEPITVEEIRLLLLGIEHRGNHATGMAFMNEDGNVHVLKNNTPAWKFIFEKETEEFFDTFLNAATKTVILHTRFATVGNPEFNENNHPMWAGKTAVVHNGGLRAYEEIWKSEKLTPSCETDSDLFRAILDRDGFSKQAINTMNKLTGSAAIAAIREGEPDTLFLARSGSPIQYALADEKMWWASEREPLFRAVRPWRKRHGLYGQVPRPDVAFFSMPDDTAYIIGATGMETKSKFEVCKYTYTAPTYRVRDSYATKMSEFKRQKRSKNAIQANQAPQSEPLKKRGVCPKCEQTLKIPAADLWATYLCTECGTRLTDLDKAKADA